MSFKCKLLDDLNFFLKNFKLKPPYELTVLSRCWNRIQIKSLLFGHKLRRLVYLMFILKKKVDQNIEVMLKKISLYLVLSVLSVLSALYIILFLTAGWGFYVVMGLFYAAIMLLALDYVIKKAKYSSRTTFLIELGFLVILVFLFSKI